MNNKVTKIIASILIVIAYIAFTLPFALDQYARIGQTSTISGYEKVIDTMSTQEIKKAWERCDAYNAKLYEDQKENYYRYRNDFDFDEEYLSLPFADSTDIATLIIPKINVRLPIGHGTEETTLQTKVGHLYGTSFPSGGKNTHTVLSGHTALRTAEMFDRLTELTEGDEIYINILDETHVYKVIETMIIDPEDHDAYMQIEEGRDLLTLYTCYPYGINTHRLLVKAERVGNIEPETGSNEKAQIKTNTITPITTLAGWILIPIGGVIILNKFMK